MFRTAGRVARMDPCRVSKVQKNQETATRTQPIKGQDVCTLGTLQSCCEADKWRIKTRYTNALQDDLQRELGLLPWEQVGEVA